MKQKENSFILYYSLYGELIQFLIEKVQEEVKNPSQDEDEDEQFKVKNYNKLVTELSSKLLYYIRPIERQ